MPKVLMVVANREVQDQEYFKTKEILESNSLTVVTTALKLDPVLSNLGNVISIDVDANYLISDDEKIKDYDAVAFIGGNGMAELVNNSTLISLAQKFYQAKKIVSAICIAPLVLANAGILRGKDATIFGDAESIDALINSGAEYLDKEVVVDQNIITACGPKASYKFGLELVKMVQQKG